MLANLRPSREQIVFAKCGWVLPERITTSFDAGAIIRRTPNTWLLVNYLVLPMIQIEIMYDGLNVWDRLSHIIY